jgi:hypothetical protein
MLILQHPTVMLGETENEVLPSCVASVFICCSGTAVVGNQNLLDVSPIPFFYAVIHLGCVQSREGNALSMCLPIEGSILGDFFE